jgi:hypothetical protein
MASLILGACRDVLIIPTPGRPFIGGRLNPMVRIPLDYVLDDEETLLRLLAEQGSSVGAGTE